MLSQIRSSWPIDDLIDEIAEEVLEIVDSIPSQYESNKYFKPHSEIIDRAISHYKNRDYISSIHLLYPRIEGIMRECCRELYTGKYPKKKQLIKASVSSRSDEDQFSNLLIPEKFSDFLSNHFFGSFDIKDPVTTENLNRDTALHGVAPVKSFDKKNSTLLFLVLEQLFYFLA
jgi:hypothetical protein